MKHLVTAFTLFCILLSCRGTNAQLARYKGVWLAQNNTVLEINDIIQGQDSVYIGNYRFTRKSLFLYGDTLSFQSGYYSSAENYKVLHTTKDNYKVLMCDDSQFIIKPISPSAVDYFAPIDTVRFIRRNLAADKDIRLQSIVFHSIATFGVGELHMEIHSDKFIKMHRTERNYHIEVFGSDNQYIKDSVDTSMNGYFTAYLSDSLYDNLINALQTCRLSTIAYDSFPLCCDGSIKTLIVYYNGERKYLKAMFPPVIMYNLLNVLYDISDDRTLQKTTQGFVLEE